MWASVGLCAVGVSLGDFGIVVGETGRLEVRGWGFPEKLDGGGFARGLTRSLFPCGSPLS